VAAVQPRSGRCGVAAASVAEEEAQGRLMQTAHVFSDVNEGSVGRTKPAARLRLSGSGFFDHAPNSPVERTVWLMA
jgi:hypothetical protein